jgi:hypothetical protein
MVNFLTSIFRANNLEDGTRRAAIETVASVREDFDASINSLQATIRDLMREQDRVTKRQQQNETSRSK